jgi:hypothetical protein
MPKSTEVTINESNLVVFANMEKFVLLATKLRTLHCLDEFPEKIVREIAAEANSLLERVTR